MVSSFNALSLSLSLSQRSFYFTKSVFAQRVLRRAHLFSLTREREREREREGERTKTRRETLSRDAERSVRVLLVFLSLSLARAVSVVCAVPVTVRVLRSGAGERGRQAQIGGSGRLARGGVRRARGADAKLQRSICKSRVFIFFWDKWRRVPEARVCDLERARTFIFSRLARVSENTYRSSPNRRD